MTHDVSADELVKNIYSYITKLSVDITDRSPGNPGNMAATDFFNKTIASFGFEMDCPEFTCIDWEHGDVSLNAGSESFQAYVSPYTLGYSGTAPLTEAATVDDLEQVECTGRILLIHGELAKDQMMPKYFPFYNPDEHKKIIGLLEGKEPAAIIAATGQNPGLVGAMYPFPMFEDGNFDIPSVYMKDVDGERLRKYVGMDITLDFDSRRIPSTACNVIAKRGPKNARKLIFCAHIDSRKYTPGALDNAAGVATLLALAELLSEYTGPNRLEIIAFNGEDYYAASGQIHYLTMYDANLDNVALVVNIDDAGYYDGKTAYSLYGCADDMAERIRNTLNKRDELMEGESWYMGDHMIFVQKQIPALAVTAEKMWQTLAAITHTEKDTIDLVDATKLAELAYGLRDLVLELE